MKKRVYICHTYYHVYVTFLKELNLDQEHRGKATLLLSDLSIDFEQLKERVEQTQLFEQVLPFPEKRDTFFPQLRKFKIDRGNIVINLFQRILFTREYAKVLTPFIPVNLKEYEEIYVYCDSDPIGYYLNQNKIKYHAIEDGLNCLKNYDSARYDNRGCFKIKGIMSSVFNLIFIQNGYGKYCIDMEVNDISLLKYKHKKYRECSREALVETLTQEDKNLILQAFLRNRIELQEQMEHAKKYGDIILILTDPLCSLEIRERIFRDIIETYEKEGTIFLKPHPRDELDYKKVFSDYPQFDGTMPMELFNFIEGIRFKKVVAVLTEVKAIKFAEEVIRLGEDFMDHYEDPLIHRQNEQI